MFLFGFSRGDYTARGLTEFLHALQGRKKSEYLEALRQVPVDVFARCVQVATTGDSQFLSFGGEVHSIVSWLVLLSVACPRNIPRIRTQQHTTRTQPMSVRGDKS